MRRVVVLGLLALLAPAAPATAQRQVAPPGNAGVDEYLETVPGPDGNSPVDRNRRDRRALDPAVRRRLEAAGPEGRVAADVAEATAPRRPGGSRRRGGSSAGSASPGVLLDRGGDGGGAPGAIARALTGSDDGGMGAGLPIVLLVSLAGAVALVLTRRTRRT